MNILIISAFGQIRSSIASTRIYSIAKCLSENYDTSVAFADYASPNSRIYNYDFASHRFHIPVMYITSGFMKDKSRIASSNTNVLFENIRSLIQSYIQNNISYYKGLRDPKSGKAFLIKKSRTFFKNLMQEFRRSERVVVFTSSGPSIMNYYGYWIKKHFPSVFWIADYRDANFRSPYRSARFDLMGKRTDLLAYRGADLITSVSRGLRDHNADNAKLLGLDIDDRSYVLYNGFLHEENNSEMDLEKVTTLRSGCRIVVAYTGVLYRQRKIECFLKALSNTNCVRLVYAGPSGDILSVFTNSASVENKVVNMGMIEREEAMLLQQSADLLLLLKGDFGEQGGMTGKFYEYLMSGKPILVLGDTDPEFNEIARKIGGIYVLPYNEERIKEFLIDFSKQWPFEIERNAQEVDKFNWNNLAKGLIEEVERRLKKR